MVTAAAVVGLYASQHMYRKALRARRGELAEPSVVETPAGNFFLGQPNALLGLAFYGALLVTTPFAHDRSVRRGRAAASTLAFASSIYLGYSLLFVTRMACPYCWTSHAMNFAIVAVLAMRDDES